jgi:AraC-like DNA-binding protein/DNA gyrase inhibitor GyrI
MNYYERVQRAIDYIEENLTHSISLETVVGKAYMSRANFYRIFFAMVGYTVKDYIRRRRISEAGQKLIETDQRILDIALTYRFESQESFTRAFKQLVGQTPGSARKGNIPFFLKRIDLMDKYYDIQDSALLEKYPDIKVLKELPPMRVAWYRHIGKNPEINAWKILSAWVHRQGLDTPEHGLRYFGFNNPCPTPDREEYGYEVWATISDKVEVNDEKIQAKIVEGGLYAVTGTTVENCSQTWQRLVEWLNVSKYMFSERQCLEEHLAIDDVLAAFLKPSAEVDIRLDLYLPIKLRKENNQS